VTLIHVPATPLSALEPVFGAGAAFQREARQAQHTITIRFYPGSSQMCGVALDPNDTPLVGPIR